MQHVPIAVKVPNRAGNRRDLLIAFGLALFLTLCWSIRDWRMLSALILPDADDMMRLAQVRDWLAGQGINDWTQYRMAPPFGAPMHWSRVNDVGIATLILGATPLIGRPAAELFAVIAYPGLLFGCSLYLSARIARRLWGAAAAPIATIMGALAYPGISVFVPGRIDHHGLQVVLIEVAVLAGMRRATLAQGLLAGAMVAVSLVIGLEAVPQLVAILGSVFAFWVVRGKVERRRLAGLAAGLAAATLPFLLFLRPTYWSPALCDAFTPASCFAAFAGAAALGGLAAASPRLTDWRVRLGAGALLGVAALTAIVALYPACLHGPYGQVSPFLRREFIVHIDEANSIFTQHSVARAVQLGGLMLVSCLAIGWIAWRYPARWGLWASAGAVVLASGLVTLAQVRGTYIGTPIAAPLLAGLVVAARRRVTGRTPATLAAWLGSAGLVWCVVPPYVHRAVLRVVDPPRAAVELAAERVKCNNPATWAALNRYPAGVVMASTNYASYMMGTTRMRTIGAGYHRNNRANLAMYRYFLSPPAVAAPIARAWAVDYVVFCPGDFDEMNGVQRFPDSVLAGLARGGAPAGFARVPLRGSLLRLYRKVS